MTSTEKLEEIARTIVHDIELEVTGGPVEYDLYVETLGDPRCLSPGGVEYGVIDIGELYQGLYRWNGEVGAWEEDLTRRPERVKSMILAKRQGRRRRRR